MQAIIPGAECRQHHRDCLDRLIGSAVVAGAGSQHPTHQGGLKMESVQVQALKFVSLFSHFVVKVKIS